MGGLPVLNESGPERCSCSPFPIRGGKWQISETAGPSALGAGRRGALYDVTAGCVEMVAVDITGDALAAGNAQGLPRRHLFFQANLGGNTYPST